MIAFYIVGMSMKILRNTLFVDLTDSIVEKRAVMMRTATEEMAGLIKKVFCYFPTIPHLKYWFTNKKKSELLRYHKEMHKQDDLMIRHPTDVI
jgi:hypothetical protein